VESPKREQTILGIDIGGTKVRLALITDSGELLRAIRYSSKYVNLEDFVSTLFEQIDVFLEDNCDGRIPIGIGIGIKALVDAKRQRVSSSSTLQVLVPYDLCGELQKRYNIKTVIDNDVNAAAIAEARFGIGRYVDDFAYINIGTGTAAGIISDRRLLRGKNNYAGELGVTLFERLDEDASLYTLESVASGKGLEDEARRLASKHPKSVLQKYLQGDCEEFAQNVFTAYKENDTLAQAAIDNALNVMALGIYNLEMLTNSHMYVFGGGVVADGWFVEQLRKKVEYLCARMRKSWTAEFRISELGADDVGVLGAASILLDALEQSNTKNK